MATMMTALLASSGIAAKGAAVASAAGGASSLFNIATIGSTLISGLAGISAAGAQAAELRGQAAVSDFQSKQELIKGTEETTAALSALNDDLGRAIVAGYANGLQGSGSVDVAIADAREQGQRNVDTSRDNAIIQAGLRKTNSRQLRASANATRDSGLFAAVGTGFKGAARIARRG